MGLRDLATEIGWLLKLKRAKSAIESEGRMYDVKVTLLKGLKGLGLGLLGVVVAAVVAYLGDSSTVTHALSNAGLSQVLVLALVPIITGGAHAFENWRKNH